MTQKTCGLYLLNSGSTPRLTGGQARSRRCAAIWSTPAVPFFNHAAYSSTRYEIAQWQCSYKGRAGQPNPLSQADRARASINNLTQSLPPNSYILVPRTWKEAHNRPDSLCAVLGIPFTELGPLLFKAGILVKNNFHEGLSFSLNGFQQLINLYNRKTSLEIGV